MNKNTERRQEGGGGGETVSVYQFKPLPLSKIRFSIYIIRGFLINLLRWITIYLKSNLSEKLSLILMLMENLQSTNTVYKYKNNFSEFKGMFSVSERFQI